ncbi:uncharacterized protein BP01DRAFT_235263 [Aspergillus saccharolyticus JOP 1030-1]|uniref:Eisosome protein 1 n=1 Tax=Aspergillus saccharolyticus JOP 1030-1 TaxID=1450539 RepID=A0A318YZE4_9EURO|nr:hypothetical protein BP01DRAFT_235263 [Aspergillus saccharolyticus JOP 1030-1]PYH40066.1 hypothetical protein BP01DRAFT_235263 [Aspergillus saccharolyticus JOP 1030-1]
MAIVERPTTSTTTTTTATLPRSRSVRLAGQAATAALYVTHPERRLSVREPSAAETERLTLKATGSRPGFSHASAVAALAHARKEAATVPVVEHHRTSDSRSQEGYKAAAYVFGNRQSPSARSRAASDFKQDLVAADPLAGRDLDDREKALRAATGALNGSRRRADSAPTDTPHVGVSSDEVLGDLDSSMEASRIQHIANTNARLYTASPPVSPEREEHKRRSVMQAAALSMAREMYAVVETKEQGRVGHAGSASQRSPTGAEPIILQQAFSLQDAAEKRAAEKLASMQDETAIYREYYGLEPQPTRSSLQPRRRRTSFDTDVSSGDADRTLEIRHQMSSLRSRLNAVDERREQDRALLMEAARKNVDATIQDMEMRVYAETGRAPPSMQKEIEEAALARAMLERQERQEADSQYQGVDRVNISSKRFVDMSDVEALARSRLQPTFDEITDRAENQRARELEQRLDQEEAHRREAMYREREVETKAEERRLRDSLRLENKPKDEKNWLWKRKPKRSSDHEEDTAAGASVGAADELSAEVVPQITTNADASATATGAVAEPTSSEPVAKPESKFRSWFKGRMGRRSSSNQTENPKESQEAKFGTDSPDTAAAAVETGPEETGESPGAGEARENQALNASDRGQSRAWDIAHPEGTSQMSELPATAEVPHEGILEEEPQKTMLKSHPMTGNDDGSSEQPNRIEADVVQQASNAKDIPTGETGRNRLMSGFKKMVSRSSTEAKKSGGVGHDVARRSSEAIPKQTVEEADRRASVPEHGLGLPSSAGKRASDGTGRESRFSERL